MNQATNNQALEELTTNALRFLADTNSFARRALSGPHVGLDDQQQFLLAHRWRMLRFSQAIEVTVRANLLDPSGALLRVLIELGYVIVAIAEDPTKIIDLFKQGQAEGRKALEGLKKELAPDERADHLTDAYLDAEIADLGVGSGFVAHNWAGLAKSKASYVTIYRLVSRHSHAGTAGTIDYFEGLDTDSPKLRPNIPAILAPEYCLVSASLIFDALTALPLQTMTADRTAELERMKTMWAALMESNNKLEKSDPC